MTSRRSAGIRSWMILRGIKQVDIQRDLGMKSRTQVHETIKGVRNDRRILLWLKAKGCPPRLLDLPTDLQEAA